MKTSLGALAVIVLLAGPASAASCEVELTDINKAISGQLNMSEGHRAAMMRMALSSYDHCMSGDTKSSGNIRDMLMTQLRENLGGK